MRHVSLADPLYPCYRCCQLALEHDHVPYVSMEPSLRAEGESLVRYLESRSCAGTTHTQLIEGITAATNCAVVAKFFPMFPKRAVQLSRWLAGWIKKGEASEINQHATRLFITTIK